MSQNKDGRTPIFCDCCGEANKQHMADRRDDGSIVISDRRHGVKHTAVVSVDKACAEVRDSDTG